MASVVSYGLCQTACNAAVVACYAAAGLTFGAATAGAALAPAAAACGAAQASCMAVCATKFLAEGSAETAASGGLMAPVIGLAGAGLAVWSWACRRKHRRR